MVEVMRTDTSNSPRLRVNCGFLVGDMVVVVTVDGDSGDDICFSGCKLCGDGVGDVAVESTCQYVWKMEQITRLESPLPVLYSRGHRQMLFCMKVQV